MQLFYLECLGGFKSTGAKIYTIGIFSGADASDMEYQSNVFMNYVSSNYPKAYGSTETDYLVVTKSDKLKYPLFTRAQLNTSYLSETKTALTYKVRAVLDFKIIVGVSLAWVVGRFQVGA